MYTLHLPRVYWLYGLNYVSSTYTVFTWGFLKKVFQVFFYFGEMLGCVEWILCRKVKRFMRKSHFNNTFNSPKFLCLRWLQRMGRSIKVIGAFFVINNFCCRVTTVYKFSGPHEYITLPISVATEQCSSFKGRDNQRRNTWRFICLMTRYFLIIVNVYRRL